MSGTQRLCDMCVSTLPVDGAVVAVMGRGGSREMVHATNSVSQELDELQFVLGEGPCIDAFNGREPVLIGDLGLAGALARWPGFAPAASEIGANAAFAFPLIAGLVRFGVLELYSSHTGDLSPADTASAVHIAESAVRVVLSDVTLQLSREGVNPSNSGRADVHRATGMIAGQLKVSIPEALSRLRASAFVEQKPILDVAREVLNRTRRFPTRTDAE
jgi:hypothetical protein